MSRSAEASLLIAAAIVAGMGVALVNFSGSEGIDAQVALTVGVFLLAFGAIHFAIRQWAPGAVPFIFPIVALLTAIGFVEVYRLNRRLGSDQRWWLLVSAAAAVAILFWLREAGVAILRRYRYLFLFVALGVLLLPLLPASWVLHGAEINGARLWVFLDLPGTTDSLSFQPGEVAKLLIVVFLASYLAERHQSLAAMSRIVGPLHLPEPRQLLPVFMAFAVSFAVLVYQRDLGASLLLFTLFVAMLYAATGRHSYLAAGALLVGVGGLAAWATFEHVQVRVSAWIHPFNDYLGSGYQVAQALFALGSGSLTGSGLGIGRPDLIPAAATDYIFAAVAEETGLAGAIAVISAYALLTAVGLGVALRSRDLFRKLLAAGLTLTLAVPSLLILGGVLRVFPVTGIALPFMSYGGSSLLANMVILALLARISHEERV